MGWREFVQGLGHRAGIHIDYWPPRNYLGLRRQRTLRWLGVDVLFDVGANVGQYATDVRKWGYEGQIVSLEPQAAAFHELEAAAQNDPQWTVRRMGLGDTAGQAEMNISPASPHSSLLSMGPRYLELAPELAYVGTETVRIETLDSVSAEFLKPSTRAALKLDVQGFEMNVLRGAPELLHRAVSIEAELLFSELYEGQAAAKELIDMFYDAGLRLAWLEPMPGSFDERTGTLDWADGMFVRMPDPT
ncbi:MAG: FkbM family methyltransferase [Solirubrobacterales bacterium]